MGFARLAEQSIRKSRGIPEGDKLGTLDRVAASTIGGALGCWNQPIEVVRVEVSRPRPATLSVFASHDPALVIARGSTRRSSRLGRPTDLT
jgi:hypothetical protein